MGSLIGRSNARHEAQTVVVEIVFGTEEFPEFDDPNDPLDLFPDLAGVIVNGSASMTVPGIAAGVNEAAVLSGAGRQFVSDSVGSSPELTLVTELDGVLSVSATGSFLFRAYIPVQAGNAVYSIIVADASSDPGNPEDQDVDSTIYVQSIRSLADINGDGSISSADSSTFATLHANGDPAADVDDDGDVDAADTTLFNTEFVLTCP